MYTHLLSRKIIKHAKIALKLFPANNGRLFSVSHKIIRFRTSRTLYLVLSHNGMVQRSDEQSMHIFIIVRRREMELLPRWRQCDLVAVSVLGNYLTCLI